MTIEDCGLVVFAEPETPTSRAVEALDALDGGDQECDHCAADDILVKLLRELGAGEAADAFERASARVGFWYA